MLQLLHPAHSVTRTRGLLCASALILVALVSTARVGRSETPPTTPTAGGPRASEDSAVSTLSIPTEQLLEQLRQQVQLLNEVKSVPGNTDLTPVQKAGINEIADRALRVLARTHSDPAQERLFSESVDYLLDARLTLIRGGDAGSLKALSREVATIVRRDPASPSAIAAMKALLSAVQKDGSKAQPSGVLPELVSPIEQTETPLTTIVADADPDTARVKLVPLSAVSPVSSPEVGISRIDTAQQPIPAPYDAATAVEIGQRSPLLQSSARPASRLQCRCRRCRYSTWKQLFRESWYGDSRVRSLMLGSSVYGHYEAHIRAGRSALLTFRDLDFENGTALLKPHANRKVREVAAKLAQSFEPVLVEAIERNPGLSQRRLQAVQRALHDGAFPVAPERVRLTVPAGDITGIEAEAVQGNLLDQVQSRGRVLEPSNDGSTVEAAAQQN